jgi:glycosyltransferase involved in cell wall biosynthesis
MPFGILKSIFGGGRKTASAAALDTSAADKGFIAFVADVDEPYFLAPEDTLETGQASLRLRVGIPARELARRVPVCLVPIGYIESDPTLAGLGVVRAIAVGKFPVSLLIREPALGSALVSWIEVMARKHRVTADFCDDLAAAAVMYSSPALAEFQRQLLLACPVTVPSSALRERLAPDARYGISVIEDPYESAAGEPRFMPGSILRFVWFGVFGPPLRASIEAQFTGIARRLAGRAAELVFVTHISRENLVREMALALREAHPNFSIRFVEWSLETTARELEHADLVVLPQDAASDWGRVKSHNRLVEAIRAGRFAVVSPVPSYLELKDYAWVGDDLADGIAWALEHPAEARARLIAGQTYIAERFAPARIGAKWADVLGISEAAST